MNIGLIGQYMLRGLISFGITSTQNITEFFHTIFDRNDVGISDRNGIDLQRR
jgi:hypothetical protein